jgi:hypothetical protein
LLQDFVPIPFKDALKGAIVLGTPQRQHMITISAYPNNPEALQARRAQAKWRKAT